MPHETALIATIAVGLTYALVGGFIAARLHLSPLVGYLLAGVAVGPFTPGFVADIKLAGELAEIGDRKSTRLNSSHGYISYAVFCLKKKKKTTQVHTYGQ